MTNNETQPSPAMSAISAMADSAPSTISQQSSTNVAPGEASVPASPATETLKHRNTEAPSPAPSSPLPASTFPLRPGETPRAFNAFRAWFELGQTRTLQAVADSLGESPGTVRNWSSKYNWNGRLQDYQSGLLDAATRQHAASHLEQFADWNRRLAEFREQEWEAAQS